MNSRFAHIPEGHFLMGSDEGHDDEQPVHRVWVDAFEFSVYPVTCGEFALFLNATDHQRPRDWVPDVDPALPVVGVSWFDAHAYCAWVNDGDGDAIRLPTEAEWERAARAGVEGSRYSWGETIPSWVPANGRGPLASPWPVTLGEPNAFGLFGIGANIHEWCADWYASDFYTVSPDRNPSGPSTGTRRASRGGSWRHTVTISRSAARSRLDPTFRYTDYGFRVARSIE